LIIDNFVFCERKGTPFFSINQIFWHKIQAKSAFSKQNTEKNGHFLASTAKKHLSLPYQHLIALCDFAIAIE
jgi:hypothetical protein